jgi:hypothetical protein
LNPSDSFMVLLVDCVHRLIESPPAVPRIHLYESPRPSAPKMGACVEGMLAFHFDGIYIKQGDHEGRPRYKNVHGKHLYCAGKAPEWLLSDSFDPPEKNPAAEAFSNAAGQLPPVGEQEWEVWDDENGKWKNMHLKTMVLATEGDVYEHRERIRRHQKQKTDAAKAAAQRQLTHVKAVSVEGAIHRIPGLWTGVYLAAGDSDGWPRFESETGKQLGYSQHRKKWAFFDRGDRAYAKRTSDLEDGELLVGTNEWKLDGSESTVSLTLMKLHSDKALRQQRARLAAEVAKRQEAAKAAAVQQLKGKAVEVCGMPQAEFNGVYIVAGDHEGYPRFENAQGKHLYHSIDNWQWRLNHEFPGADKSRENEKYECGQRQRKYECVRAWVDSVEGQLPVGNCQWLEQSRRVSTESTQCGGLNRCRKALVTVTLLSSRLALQQQTQHLREALQAGKHSCVKQIFAMFDADCDGWLNHSEYTNYLEGLGALSIARWIDLDDDPPSSDCLCYDDDPWWWTCKAIAGCSVDRGIHFKGFEEVIYGPGLHERYYGFRGHPCGTHDTSKAQADLDKCKAWAAMSDSERRRHKTEGCLLPHTVEKPTRCCGLVCKRMISEGDLIYRCERCDHRENYLCEQCHVKQYARSQCSADEAEEIFKMFDIDRDGKLNKDEYYSYLEAVQAVPRDYILLTFDGPSHSFHRARSERYDTIGWPQYCEELACSPDEGITSHAFRFILYREQRAGLSREDLERCKARGAMSESERQRHDSERYRIERCHALPH